MLRADAIKEREGQPLTWDDIIVVMYDITKNHIEEFNNGIRKSEGKTRQQ